MYSTQTGCPKSRNSTNIIRIEVAFGLAISCCLAA
jgi:hypothetical protein